MGGGADRARVPKSRAELLTTMNEKGLASEGPCLASSVCTTVGSKGRRTSLHRRGVTVRTARSAQDFGVPRTPSQEARQSTNTPSSKDPALFVPLKASCFCCPPKMSNNEPRVELVPWDHDSSEHVERMYLQRLACGWRSEEVHEQWVELCQKGRKTLYWVVSVPGAAWPGGKSVKAPADEAGQGALRGPGRQGEADKPAHRRESQGKELIVPVVQNFETARRMLTKPTTQESLPIHDTAATHWRQPRRATRRSLAPLGHIALDLRPEQNAELKLTDDGIVWVAGLYISAVLQAGGLGRETMSHAEDIASREPLKAKWIVLDTMPREQQVSPAVVEKFFSAQGKPRPLVTTQDWYERQGYGVLARGPVAYTWVSPATGKTEQLNYLFLRKQLR